MHARSFARSTAIMLLLSSAAYAQESPKPGAETPPDVKDVPKQVGEAADPATTEAAAAQAELEAKFKKTLTNATMTGRWALIKDGALTPEQPDKYTIVGVNKIFGERWLIRARIQYGQKDITAPIPVRVKWAGDTPVITLDDVGLPGGASYSARVIIYDDSYAGTWSGGDMRGLLNGMITQEKE